MAGPKAVLGWVHYTWRRRALRAAVYLMDEADAMWAFSVRRWR